MHDYTRINWKALLVASALLISVQVGAQMSAAQAAPALSKAEGSGLKSTEKTTKYAFYPVGLAADGWPVFLHGGKKLKIGAPAPAVPLIGAEKRKWAKDIATFKFDGVKDRQVLYVYDLSNKKTAKVVLNTLNPTVLADKAGKLRTAIGAVYDTASIAATGQVDVYRRAALPVKWNQAIYDYVKSKHDPKAVAMAVGAITAKLPKYAYYNFEAVGVWSALAKQYKASLAKEVRELKSKSTASVNTGTYEVATKGPLTWVYLKPIGSFIAVNRDLDITGIKAERVLTSKKAWQLIEK